MINNDDIISFSMLHPVPKMRYLVNSLVKQLNGSLKIEGAYSTFAMIQFGKNRKQSVPLKVLSKEVKQQA